MMTRAEIEIVGLQNARNTVVCNCRIGAIKKKGASHNAWWKLHHSHAERSPTFWSTPFIQASPYFDYKKWWDR